VSRRPVAAVLAGCLLLAIAACGADRRDPATAGTVTVLAAVSLTEVFTALGEGFEQSHPGRRVRLSFAGSAQLAGQIAAGAPADVFAAAGPESMQRVAGGRDAVVFARNQLVIAVPPGNPRGLRTLADLAVPDLKVAICAAQVPCGIAAEKALASAGVDLTPVTLDQNVRAALTKVRLGEVDAALVYRTDVRVAAGEVEAVEFAESAAAGNDYPIVVLPGAADPAAAAEFVAYVRSGAGRERLREAGFQLP